MMAVSSPHAHDDAVSATINLPPHTTVLPSLTHAVVKGYAPVPKPGPPPLLPTRCSTAPKVLSVVTVADTPPQVL